MDTLSCFSLLHGYFFVIVDQPKITVQPQGKTKTEGDNLTLSCNTTGNPVAKISWTRNGTAVNSSGRISFSADNKQLTITNVSRTDNGEYRCVARNSLGNDTSNTAKVDIQCNYFMITF